MSVYIFLILFAFFSFLHSYRQPNVVGYYFVFTIIALILCFGYMCGSDWRAYEEIYNSYSDPSLGGFWWRFLYFEPLYLCLNVIGNELHMGFWCFYLLLRVLIYIKIVQIFMRFCPKELVLLAFTFYLGFWGIRHLIDPSFRNLIAACVFLCSLDDLINRKLKNYLLWILAATLIHYSSICLVLVYFLVNRKYSNGTIVILFILINVIFAKPDIIFEITSRLFSFIPVIALKVENYTLGAEAELGQGKIFSIIYFIHLLFFILILYNRKKIEALDCGKFLFNMSILFIFSFRLGLTALIFSRLQLFLAYFYAIVVAYLIYSFVKKSRLIFAVFVLLISVFANMKQMANVYFVPYTNYFLHAWKDYSFEERSNYNFKNSPYKKD